MSKKILITIFGLGLLILFVSQTGVGVKINRHLAALFFPERISLEELMDKYERNKKIKILIVPGHDNESWGASFVSVKEVELNLEVGRHLFEYFRSDGRFEASITRGENGYVDDFKDYLKEQFSLISEFRKYWQTVFRGAVKRGLVEEKVLDYHGTASPEDSLKLYGINKWANDNDINVVIHLHFNDYPGRFQNRVGKYSGFSIYVPEEQLPNSRVSQGIATSVFSSLGRYFSSSDLPKEKNGIIED